MTGLAARLLLGVTGLAGLVVLGAGLIRTVSFERTPAGVSNERIGQLLILGGCAVLLLVAAGVSRSGPGWAVLAVAAPAVLCGGLTVLAGGTLLPQIVALPAFGAALAGIVASVVQRAP